MAQLDDELREFIPKYYQLNDDLVSPRNIHLIGIAGTGMRAIAIYLHLMGHRVSGSDIKLTTAVKFLKSLGIEVFNEQVPQNVLGKDICVYSTAVSLNNPEIRSALENNVALVHRSAILDKLSKLKKTIAVAGSHGKTTTSSITSLILEEARLRPSYIIGSEINDPLGASTYKESEYFVLEADESDGSFLLINPYISVLTSLEPDHLNNYSGDFNNLKKAAKYFLNKGELAVVSKDVKDDLGMTSAFSVGDEKGSDFFINILDLGPMSSTFSLSYEGIEIGEFKLNVPGLIYVKNASFAASVAHLIGIGYQEIKDALMKFRGISRRFEIRGKKKEILFIDDYAHLPTEIKETIKIARKLARGKLVVVFQPHRYSRIAYLYRDFKDAFVEADSVIITEIYPAGEKPIVGISSDLVYQEVKNFNTDTYLIPEKQGAIEFLKNFLKPGDTVLTLGAGDLTLLVDALMEEL